MEKELYSRLEIVLRSGEFQDLSETDKKLVQEELGGEKGFTDLRKLILQVKDEEVPKVKAVVKEDLMKSFSEKNSKPSGILSYRTPMVANLAAMLVMGLVLWYFLPRQVVEKTVVQTIEGPSVVDTVFIESPPDTLYLEKRVFVKEPVYITKVVEKERKQKEIRSLEGLPLEEQSDLRDLILKGKE